MSIQAIIMAGGEGMRLRPLTSHIPKPLVPLLGEPVMGYSVKLLKTYGVRDIGATLWYQPEKIRRAFGSGEGYGVSLRYYEETEPLGTAGSVKMAKDEIKEPFFVLSGDGLTDCDLTDALRFHREKKALATLVLKRVPVPLAFGVVMTDGDSRVTRFIEKPGWSRVFSDLVNTGAYIFSPEIFDYIPDTGAPDFGKDIFPALLAGGLPVYGYETKGYWCDVGDLKTYLQAQRDLLEDVPRLPHAQGVHPDAKLAPSARLEGVCFIGPGASVGPGAVVRDSVIGANCVIGAGAVVEDSCLWTG
ncbi:MAG: NDP-sugar synthase, partial [Clostridia bacterium]|nr:NDP-sugar synthase [Clostridia bacterium]